MRCVWKPQHDGRALFREYQFQTVFRKCSSDGSRWIYCKRSRQGKDYFLPVTVLSEVFRGKFIDFLKREYRRGELQFHGQLERLAQEAVFEQRLNCAVRNNWTVDARRPFASAEIVLKYLARYTHRVAISNCRLIAMQDGKVHFRWKDYADGGRQKTMELEAVEFMRRFLLHVLPRGFVRIRYYGFLANAHRSEKLALCRSLLGQAGRSDKHHDERREGNEDAREDDPIACPVCGQGHMIIIQVVDNDRSRYVPPRRPFMLSLRGSAIWDSS
ncbi:MAG: transposase [Acidiferrobacterales bacterium]